MTTSSPIATILKTERAIIEGIRAKDHRRVGERYCLSGTVALICLSQSRLRGSVISGCIEQLIDERDFALNA
jgi:hypothetical protein